MARSRSSTRLRAISSHVAGAGSSPAAPRDTFRSGGTGVPPADLREITLAEVAEHKSRRSMWVVIRGLVYDFTRSRPPAL